MVDKLNMTSMDNIQENIKKIQQLFPNAVTEVLRDGKPTLAIDFDILKQEMSGTLIDDKEERYQFTWPDKKKSILLANSPISATLRPCKEESVDFDNTQNLYIEGDNLDVLKLLQETYLGKIKMIYIDPPYNTGNDFVYNDDFSQNSDEYIESSGQYDDQGNRLVQNTESNGRFHTDWLNMIYPRLKVSKDLLSDDGIIFISIDDNEQENLKKVCDEVFGSSNFIANFVRKNKAGSGHDSGKIAIEFDYILCYAKNYETNNINQELVDIDNDPKYRLTDSHEKERGKYYLRDLDYKGSYSEKMDYPITTPDGTIIYSGGQFGKPNTWRWSKDKFVWGLANDFIVFKKADAGWKVYIKQYQFVDNNGDFYQRKLPYRALVEYMNGQGSTESNELLGNNVFSYPKTVEMLKYLINVAGNEKAIILDFFSGSATTAHAVMQLNAEDGGKRKFIMVQLPEKCDEKSEAFKAGYKNICEIGKERIRRAGKKIIKESPLTTQNLDTGFRVLKLDSSNMKDVYYKSNAYTQDLLSMLEDNIKEDRSPLDLLFQVMLELGKPLSAKIEEKEMSVKTNNVYDNKIYNAGNGYTGRTIKYYCVDDNDLIACFDKNVTEEVVKAIALLKPLYAVFRDSSLENDSANANLDQIFATYSPNTTRKVL